MFRRTRLTLAVGAAAALGTAGIAGAAVTFDPATGSGFVGKGDVQTPLGLKNSTMQALHTGVSFTYDSSEEYSVTCEWTTGEGTRGERTHVLTRNRSSGVTATVDSSGKKTGQWTGWRLSGLKDVVISGTGAVMPAVGDPCNGNSGQDSVVTAVGDVTSTGSGLVAHLSGYPDVPLSPTP